MWAPETSISKPPNVVDLKIDSGPLTFSPGPSQLVRWFRVLHINSMNCTPPYLKFLLGTASKRTIIKTLV
jgi:hypothetical protein